MVVSRDPGLSSPPSVHALGLAGKEFVGLADEFLVGFVARATKTPAESMPPVPQLVILLLECGLALSGLGFLGWLAFGKRGRAFRGQPAALQPWDIAVPDFLALGWFILVFGLVGVALAEIFAGPIPKVPSDARTLKMLLYGSMLHFAAIITWPLARTLARSFRPASYRPYEALTSTSVRQAVRGGGLTFLVAMPLILAASFLWERLLEIVGLPTERQELVDLFFQAKSPVLLAFLITLALVLAPVAEELVFRVGIFRFLRSRAPRWVAYVVSAGLFSAMHGNWFSALPLFVLGLVFAAGYERTGRIAVPMVAHALFNLNTLLLVLSGVGG